MQGQLWNLIVSIPDLCTLTYFYMKFEFNWLSGSEEKMFENVDRWMDAGLTGILLAHQ